METIGVTDHLGVVRMIARKVRIAYRLPGTMDHEDLVQEGAVGLLEASRRFDPERGIAFTTYAAFRIRGAMLDVLRKCGTRAEAPAFKANLSDGVFTDVVSVPAVSEEVARYGRDACIALGRIREDDRACVLDRLAGETFAVIGKRLGISGATAYRRHKKVLARLRREIVRKPRSQRIRVKQ